MEEFLDNLRNDHSDFNQGTLDDRLKEVDPIQLFKKWYQEAYDNKCPEPNAMTVSTVGKSMMPSSRIIYLKELIAEGFVFYTNYESKKGQDLVENPKISILFYWESLARQVIVQGVVEKASEEMSDEYFNSRPRGSQIGAWASQQSRVVEDRSVLENEIVKIEARFKNTDVTRPPFWGGYIIKPLSIEFWQGRPSRLHDRICFFKEEVAETNWKVVRKNP